VLLAYSISETLAAIFRYLVIFPQRTFLISKEKYESNSSKKTANFDLIKQT
jgi:hypothetical protein